MVIYYVIVISRDTVRENVPNHRVGMNLFANYGLCNPRHQRVFDLHTLFIGNGIECTVNSSSHDRRKDAKKARSISEVEGASPKQNLESKGASGESKCVDEADGAFNAQNREDSLG